MWDNAWLDFPFGSPVPTCAPHAIAALKKMDKLHILGEKQADHINNERKLLASCDSPFINHVYAAFQDATDLCLLLEVSRTCGAPPP